MAISLISKYASECMGTFILVFCVGLVKVNSHMEGSDLGDFGPTAVGFCLMALIYLFGSISGAHLNPAVTFAALLQKEIELNECIMYWAFQFGGGALAGVFAGMMFGYENTGVNVGPSSHGFWLGAPLVEFLYTFLLCFVFLNVCLSKQHTEHPNNFYGLAIGFVVIAGGYGGGAISGGAFNPAVTLGCTFMGVSWKVLWLPIYIAVQLVGAIIAVCVFHIVRPDSRVTHEGKGGGCAKRCVDKLMDLFDPEDTTECVGTMFYMLSASLNALGGNAGSVFSNAATFICLNLALGDISGGLFNPAITLACLGRFFGTGEGFGEEKLCDPKHSAKEGPKYVIAQLVGATAGAALVLLIYVFSGRYPAAQIGCVPVYALDQSGNAQYGCKDQFVWQAFFAELFGTFFLAYAFLGISTTKTPHNEYEGFAIGAVILAGGYCFGPLSGGVLNPAVTVANSAFYKLQLFYTLPPILYFVGQCLGGVLAALTFRFITHTQEYDGAAYTTMYDGAAYTG